MTPSRTCFSLNGRIIWWLSACSRIQRSLLMAIVRRSPFLVHQSLREAAQQVTIDLQLVRGNFQLSNSHLTGSPMALTIRGGISTILATAANLRSKPQGPHAKGTPLD